VEEKDMRGFSVKKHLFFKQLNFYLKKTILG